MILDKLKSLWEWVDKINSGTKTLLIVILLSLLVPKYTLLYYNKIVVTAKTQSEDYSTKVSLDINRELYRILYSDPSMTNALLLNFHNTKENPSGFSFIYMSPIGEAPREIPCASEWKELEYITYVNEVLKIYNASYVSTTNILDLKYTYPNIYRKLYYLGVNSVAIYPIKGVDRKLGLLILTYDKAPHWGYGYYERTIADPLQQITSMLDYRHASDIYE